MRNDDFEPTLKLDAYTQWRSRSNPMLTILEQNGEFKPSDGKGYIGEGSYGTLELAIQAFYKVRR